MVLREKEGLALINGTDGMLGMLVLALADLRSLLTTVDVTAAMSVEGLLGTDDVFAADLQALRPHPGQAASASNLRRLLADSPIRESHRTEACTARAGRLLATLLTAGRRRGTGHRRLRSAGRRPRTRRRRGQPRRPARRPGRVQRELPRRPGRLRAGLPGDRRRRPRLIAERRTDRLLDEDRYHGLPPFLADDPGVDSGLMIAQYTQAALVSEIKRLAVPASVDSIPSSAMQEDHVSMGWSAARKLRLRSTT